MYKGLVHMHDAIPLPQVMHAMQHSSSDVQGSPVPLHIICWVVAAVVGPRKKMLESRVNLTSVI